jgi:hypothetical protein
MQTLDSLVQPDLAVYISSNTCPYMLPLLTPEMQEEGVLLLHYQSLVWHSLPEFD